MGNLPGSVDYMVSTGGSGGGAHAAMFAATSNNADYFDYEIAVGAVGVYADKKGKYSTVVTIDDEEKEISDGAWGCIAYSAITPLAEADMDMAFEYDLDADYDFNTSFQKKLAKYLSKEYMEYINDKELQVSEADAGVDINNDGDKKDKVDLTIEHSDKTHKSTNGYYGTYLDLYLAEFMNNLQSYIDNLDYADDWTWFDANGKALSDSKVKAMTLNDKAKAFLEGRYAKSTSSSNGGMTGSMPSGSAPSGSAPGGSAPTGNAPSTGQAGTPQSGTTQASGSSKDSSDYSSFSDMTAAYKKDIESIEKGDDYGRNIVDLYDPMKYIGQDGTDAPAWTRIVMGAAEGDMSLFASMNMQIAWLDSGTDACVEWQWDGGHVPSEILGDSFSLYVDEMYGKYADGAKKIKKPAAEKQTKNGSASSATGTDISKWVKYSSKSGVSFSLAKAAAYRTAGAAKAIPGFDVIDYGQEDYVFGSTGTNMF